MITSTPTYTLTLNYINGTKFIVGNFGTGNEVKEFLNRANKKPEAICGGLIYSAIPKW